MSVFYPPDDGRWLEEMRQQGEETESPLAVALAAFYEGKQATAEDLAQALDQVTPRNFE